jgi:hypothetical protein
LADAEDAPLVEATRQIVDVQPPTLDQLLECPEGELRVVRRQSDASAVGTFVRQVVPDFAMAKPSLPRQQRFRRVAERIADSEPEQHASHPLGRDGR